MQSFWPSRDLGRGNITAFVQLKESAQQNCCLTTEAKGSWHAKGRLNNEKPGLDLFLHRLKAIKLEACCIQVHFSTSYLGQLLFQVFCTKKQLMKFNTFQVLNWSTLFLTSFAKKLNHAIVSRDSN